MPKIDFYVLPDAAPEARDRVACRVAEKAYGLGHRVHIHTGSRQDALRLDALLWTFHDRSFIPHDIEPAVIDECPISIGHDWTPPRREVLINLAPHAPTFFDRFERVAEIICNTAEAQDLGRKRYRFYRERGCELHHHTLSR